MKLIQKIYEQDIGLRTDYPKESLNYKIRRVARAIVFNRKDEIAILHVRKYNYYKLPGGGVEKGESLKDALKREIFEEVGCRVKLGEEVGEIIEYRDKITVEQVSYCWITRVIGKINATAFTEKELSDEFKLIWIDFKKALEIFKNNKTDDYFGKFIIKRDLEFLLMAKKKLNMS